MLETCRTSGTSGWNGSRMPGTPVSESAPNVVPWYAMCLAIALYRLPGCAPRAMWNCRASFHADSTASEPPDTKKTRLRSPGASDATSSASSIARGCEYDQFV